MAVSPPIQTPPGTSRGADHRLPRFFFNSAGTSPPSSPVEPRQHDRITSPPASHHHLYSGQQLFSGPSTPSHPRRPSKASATALRSAMTSYRMPTSAEYFPGVMNTDDTDVSPLPSPTMDRHHVDACLEIHRTLYRGREDSNAATTWREHAPFIQRAVEQLIDADCKYDHPLVRIQTRQSVLTHFILLHILSTGYIPHLTPSNVIHVVSVWSAHLRYRTLGHIQAHDVESSPAVPIAPKGKRKLVQPDWTSVIEKGQIGEHDAKWWRLWDVSANCTDIGNLHSQNGNHFTLIEHVITLTLFPSLIKRHHPHSILRPSESDVSLVSGDEPVRRSFTDRLVTAVAEELDYLFTWDLPVSTTVRFNENGKATQIRDSVDIVDVVETFVPFAKRIGWLTRRLTGMVSSSLGGVALTVAPTVAANIGPDYSRATLGSPIGLGLHTPARPSHLRPSWHRRLDPENNSLGLEGIAPDSRSVFSS